MSKSINGSSCERRVDACEDMALEVEWDRIDCACKVEEAKDNRNRQACSFIEVPFVGHSRPPACS